VSDPQTPTSAVFRQPGQALQPAAFTIEAVERWALERAAPFSADAFRVTSFWLVDFVRQAVPGERKTHYTMRLAQSENYGIAFGSVSTPSSSDRDLLGEDARQILRDRRCRDNVERVALLDLVMAHVAPAAGRQLLIDKSVRDKQAHRSQLFAEEAERILERKGLAKAGKPKILVIGATAGIINALVSRGFEVAATDMSEDVQNQILGGVIVRSDTANLELIQNVDLAIITGMTLPNGTLTGLIAAAKHYNTSTMIWAITGRNLGHYYTAHGVDCVIADPSPFFLLPGPAKIEIWHREH
jgi:hypothetical protein